MSFIQSRHGNSTFEHACLALNNNLSTDVVVAQAVLVLKSLVQIRTEQSVNPLSRMMQQDTLYSPLGIISRLAYKLDEIHHPKARACVIWLVGQYAPATSTLENGVPTSSAETPSSWAPDVLRKSAKTFTQEVRHLTL